ncbi:MAG: hypothetical protein AB1705_22630 [Verrucomicrobiota bacterium]
MTPILNPVRTVNVQGEAVEVRELRALDALQFFKLLSAHAGKLVNDQGNITLSLDRLVELVSGVEELARYLLLKSTGRDEAWLRGVSFGESLDVLDAALELNLTEDLLKKARRLGDRVKALFGQGKPS